MDEQAVRDHIVEELKKKSGTKSKFYLKDFYAMVPDMKKMHVSKLVNKMVAEDILEYWSSGSTTMIGLKGAGKQHATEEGE
ncbi:dissimilatory sulfite reductase D family protein [Desulfovibrio inopinatus]|uniref:dissimilatory sulfite reductase D family protein n=1 Tax=Desulfovibrio inopinatus TaxID=102109 RepID=UPI0004117A15|nr:dissimilatory sulfite reductase D family protein [Desulfovibrio inopinatus]